MNLERKLLAAAMDSRQAFGLLEKHLEQSDLTEPGRVILGEVAEYYDRDASAETVDGEVLAGLVLQTVSNPKHKETFEHIMEGLNACDVSGMNVAAEILGAKREAMAAKLSISLTSGADDASDLAEQYLELSQATSLSNEEESDLLHAPSITDLVGESTTGDLIRCYPKSLNERLDGGLMRGHHMLVFARPEMGKTMFLINLVFGFLAQRCRVLYVGNEEPIEDTTLRIIGRLAQMTRYEILNGRETAFGKAMDHGYDHLFLKRMTPGTIREIDTLTAAVQPDVLIVDQIRNINVREDNRTQQLEAAANAVRQIGGRHKCVVISATQAGDSASGKAILDQSDVDSSKTGIPGAVDVMVGIGATQEDERAGRRVLSLPKNKRGGGHGFFPVLVEPTTARITSND